MAKPRLGALLVKAGVITDSQLRVALSQQRQHGGKVGEHLVRTNLISEQQLAIAIADQLGLVYNDCSQGHAAEFSSMLPEPIAQRLQAVPVRYDRGTDTLHVAVADPLDEGLLAELVRETGKHIEMQVAPKSALRQFIKVAYSDVEIHDEGTNEFQLVDIHGRVSAVSLSSGDDELPEASVLEMEPVSPDATLPTRKAPFPPSPRRAAAQPAAAARADSGEEALRLLWALTDLLIERGYFSRAELMQKLREK